MDTDETEKAMGYKPVTRVDALLGELCVKYGYCLPPDDQAALIAEPPQDVDAFVDAVLLAEGHDNPSLCNDETRRALGELVRDWLFDEGRGKGSKSGLPRLLPPDG